MGSKVLIADDHVAVREGIIRVLSESCQCEFGLAATRQELFEKLNAEPWELLILDLGMPDKNSLELIGEIKAKYPPVKVLVYTNYPENQIGIRALRAGADGLLSKDAPGQALIAAAQRVLSGKRYISEGIADQLASALCQPTPGPAHETLSDREFRVLLLLGLGSSPAEIAGQLHVSVKTVSSYRIRILQKLKLKSTAELIRYAVEHKLC